MSAPPKTQPNSPANATVLRSGGLAAVSVRHPVGVSMIALAVVVLGLFSLGRLGVDLLPHIIYPDVRVRILDPGVPGRIMEDQVTRQLEEQLAITEDSIGVVSSSSEGRSRVDLSFEFGKDVDVALRDASTRLDRAKRFLPDTIDPPVIFKRDPSQIPVLEMVITSDLQSPAELRSWVDYTFSKWFVNLPGVAAVEVGGAPQREIRVLPDQQRLAGFGLSMDDVVDALRRGNLETPAGRLRMSRQEISGRTSGRLPSIEAISSLPLVSRSGDASGATIRLGDVADVVDTVTQEKLRIRLNGRPGVKVAIQKQPQANTVAVVDAVNAQLATLREQRLLPDNLGTTTVSDEAVFVRQAIRNASVAAGSGALLAMLVVYFFLGDIRRTLVIGSAIPLGVMVATILMNTAGLTLNIMTLGGLALGVGLLVDNTIVMLENIFRNQGLREENAAAGAPADDGANSRAGDRADKRADAREANLAGAIEAAREVNGAVVASTTTNLAAVLPFLFIGGLVGLLFRELVMTIAGAIVASLVVALTVVPALGSRIPVARPGLVRRTIDWLTDRLAGAYARLLRYCLKLRWLVPVPFLVGLWFALPAFDSSKQVFMPDIDDGRIRAYVVADSGISLREMDRTVGRIERLLLEQPEVESVFSQVGGFVFGRSEREATNLSRLTIALVPRSRRTESIRDWIGRMNKTIAQMKLAGVKVRMRPRGVRGLRSRGGNDDVTIRVQGPELEALAEIGSALVRRLQGTPGLRNVAHSYEDLVQELTVRLDRERAAVLGLDVAAVGRALRIAMQGIVATDYLEGDRSFDVRVQLPTAELTSPRDIETILLFPEVGSQQAVYLGDVAAVELSDAPARIVRDRQQRIVEISASLAGDVTLGEATRAAWDRIADFELPVGYTIYDSGAAEDLARSERLARLLLGLAIFLVFVVMAVQYESLLNPFVILLGVPFAAIGVAVGINVLQLPLSMPLWLGLIMLAGIVVNNSIVLIEYVELERERGVDISTAIVNAGRLRFRPILMTTLTTVAGMSPLAAGLGEGAEMLQPLAIAIVFGLSFSMLVSLLLVPVIYRLIGRRDAVSSSQAEASPVAIS